MTELRGGPLDGRRVDGEGDSLVFRTRAGGAGGARAEPVWHLYDWRGERYRYVRSFTLAQVAAMFFDRRGGASDELAPDVRTVSPRPGGPTAPSAD